MQLLQPSLCAPSTRQLRVCVSKFVFVLLLLFRCRGVTYLSICVIVFSVYGGERVCALNVVVVLRPSVCVCVCARCGGYPVRVTSRLGPRQVRTHAARGALKRHLVPLWQQATVQPSPARFARNLVAETGNLFRNCAAITPQNDDNSKDNTHTRTHNRIYNYR